MGAVSATADYDSLSEGELILRVLVIGGSGYLGTLVLPFLAQTHTLRVFDLQSPANTGLDYVHGSVCDPLALASAMPDMDAVIYMAMGSQPQRYDEASQMEAKITAFDVSVKGLYLALEAAHQAGIAHAVYTSSMSVYADNGVGRFGANEDTPPDAVRAYGLTKHLGEEVCRHACHVWGMSVNALRLFFPISEAKWQAEAAKGEPTPATTAQDTARAVLVALEYRAGYEAFTISGDYEQKLLSLAKAKRLLSWEPQARPSRAEGTTTSE
jgi:nucleoside-diphosphate-sugar epimerase